VLLEHVADVHLVDVVAAEDAHVLGRRRDDVLRLEDRVGRALEPALARALLRRDGLDVLSSIGDRCHERAMCSSSDALLYCVSTLMR
jgi:hypothetical protein